MTLLFKIREAPVSVSGIGAIPGISDNRYHDIGTSSRISAVWKYYQVIYFQIMDNKTQQRLPLTT